MTEELKNKFNTYLNNLDEELADFKKRCENSNDTCYLWQQYDFYTGVMDVLEKLDILPSSTIDYFNWILSQCHEIIISI